MHTHGYIQVNFQLVFAQEVIHERAGDPTLRWRLFHGVTPACREADTQVDKGREMRHEETLIKTETDRRTRRGGDKQRRGEIRGRRGTSGKCAAHLPDGSFGAQRAAMSVLQHGALPPDCHTLWVQTAA